MPKGYIGTEGSDWLCFTLALWRRSNNDDWTKNVTG